MKRSEAQFDFGGDEGLRRLDGGLRRAMPVDPPPGLAERVLRSTADELATRAAGAERPLAPLEAELDEALRPRAPGGLAGRVYRASAMRLPVKAKHSAGAGERGGVIGRIARSPMWRGAIAAAVVAAVSLGIWLSVGQDDAAVERPVAEAPQPDAAPMEVAVLLDQIERSLEPTRGPIAAELIALSVEADELERAFDEPLLAGGFAEPTDRLHDELMLLEAGLDLEHDF